MKIHQIVGVRHTLWGCDVPVECNLLVGKEFIMSMDEYLGFWTADIHYMNNTKVKVTEVKWDCAFTKQNESSNTWKVCAVIEFTNGVCTTVPLECLKAIK